MSMMVSISGMQDSAEIREILQSDETLSAVQVEYCAEDARSAFSQGSFESAWVISCKDMGALNLAAAMAKDVPEAPVYSIGDMGRCDLGAVLARSGIRKILPEHALLEMLGIEISRKAAKASEARGASELEEVLEPDEPQLPQMAETPQSAPKLQELQKPNIEGTWCAASPSLSPAGPMKRGAFVISVMSGSGGVGKSTTVATAAYLAASRGFSVVVLDCDLQFGDMGQMMGNVSSTTIDDMLMDEALLPAFAKGCDKDIPALIRAPQRLERSEELSSHLGEMLDMCAQLFDVVFVNTGSSWSDVNAQLIEKSSCNLFIVDQRASSVRACQHAIELCMRMGLATGQFIYALNRCDKRSLFSAIDISNAMHGANVVELKEGGQEVEELLGMGLAGELAASKNDFTDSLDRVLAEVLP